MITRVFDARLLYQTQDVGEKFRRAIADRPHISPTTADGAVASVNHNRWIVLCSCGSGCAVDLILHRAWCFECGTIYDGIEVPHDAAAIEALLVKRPKLENRNWIPGESLDQLEDENRQNGVV